jgi:hypothetical protein
MADGGLPADYASRFCHPTSVDGHFLAFFGLDRVAVMAAGAGSDDEVSRWFLALPSAQAARIGEWNHVAVNLGRPGFPMADRLPVALATTYGHLARRKFDTVFDVLDADESTAPAPHREDQRTHEPHGNEGRP